MSDESNQNITISDQASAKDSLGLKPYVIAMAEFLTHPDTKPPLTISIEGEWGSGKSSFMKQLEEQITVKSEDLKKQQLNEYKTRRSRWWYSLELRFGQKTQTVWFNAWRHDKAESLWATFAISFLEEISRNRNCRDLIPNLLSSLQLFWKRQNIKEKPLKFLNTVVSASVIVSVIVILIVGFFKVGVPGISNFSEQIVSKIVSKDADKNKNTDSLLTLSLLFGGGGGSLAGVFKLLSKLKELIGDPKMDLTQYLESPDYKSQVAFVEKFHADFRKIVEAYIGKDEKVYVFIDDLDRCELSKAADLLQALNMMISNDPQIIFILGMDREKVAAGITYKQKDVLPYLASIAGKNQDPKDTDTLRKQVDYGFSYLEKFVQLSFTLPKPSENSLNEFFGGLATTDKANPQEKSILGIYKNRIIEKFDGVIDGTTDGIISGGKYILYLLRREITIDNVKNEFIEIAEKCQEVIKDIKVQKKPQKDDPEKEVKKESEVTEEKNPNRPESIFPIVKKHLGKEEKEDLVKMVAPFFDNNPRRLKQYINALRLKRYMYYYAIGVKWAERGKITQQQLGKFIAITLRHPSLLYELRNNDKLLDQLEDCAIDKFNCSKGFNDSQNTEPEPTDSNQKNPNYGDALYWVNTYPKIAKLLCYEEDENNYPKCILSLKDEYSLKNEGIKKLLEVSPKLELDPKYFKLREFLEANNWKDADEETLKVMLKVAKREKQRYLDIKDIENFPCDELYIIDQLWVKYSYGRFGFSVQKDIYRELGGTTEYNNEIWENFGDRVGWYNKSKWLDYDQLTFTYTPIQDTTPDTETKEVEEEKVKQSSTTSTTQDISQITTPPKGHLPALVIIHYRFGPSYVSFLASRLVNCNI